MKHLFFLFIFISCSIILTQSCSIAKKTAVTTENAVSKGYTAMNLEKQSLFIKYQHPAHLHKEADK